MRVAYLSQAYEFGRCPSQAFTEPHPPKAPPAAAATAAAQDLQQPPVHATADTLPGTAAMVGPATADSDASAGDTVGISGGGSGSVGTDATAAAAAVVVPEASANASAGTAAVAAAGASATATISTTDHATWAAAAGVSGAMLPGESLAEAAAREWRGQEGARVRAAAEARIVETASGNNISTRLRTSMRQLENELSKAGSELTVRETALEKRRTTHADTCASLSRWYREKERASEGSIWEMSIAARLEDQAQRHETNAAQWQGERDDLVRKLEISEQRQRELAVQTERSEYTGNPHHNSTSRDVSDRLLAFCSATEGRRPKAIELAGRELSGGIFIDSPLSGGIVAVGGGGLWGRVYG